MNTKIQCLTAIRQCLKSAEMKLDVGYKPSVVILEYSDAIRNLAKNVEGNRKEKLHMHITLTKSIDFPKICYADQYALRAQLGVIRSNLPSAI